MTFTPVSRWQRRRTTRLFRTRSTSRYIRTFIFGLCNMLSSRRRRVSVVDAGARVLAAPFADAPNTLARIRIIIYSMIVLHGSRTDIVRVHLTTKRTKKTRTIKYTTYLRRQPSPLPTATVPGLCWFRNVQKSLLPPRSNRLIGLVNVILNNILFYVRVLITLTIRIYCSTK